MNYSGEAAEQVVRMSLNGVEVIRVGDGRHCGTIHRAVSLDSDLALRIGNLFDTNDCFHYVLPPYFLSLIHI